MPTNLTEYLKTATGFSDNTVRTVVDSTVAFISSSLRVGEEVRIEGLGNFKIVDKPERQGRSPRSGEMTTFKASRKPKLTFVKTFLTSIQLDPSAATASIEPTSETPKTATTPPPTAVPVAPTVAKIPPIPAVPVAPTVAKIPPIPADLLLAEQKAQLELMWQIKAPDDSFVEVKTSELVDWGVGPNTPVYSPATGWKLAGKVPELAGIVG